MTIQPGDPLIAGYRSFNLLAHGGFSSVFTAYQESLDRTVAIKVINADLADARAVRRFTRECRATGRLTGHPNIITVFETGSTRQRRPFIAMRYLPNGSVADRLRGGQPMRPDEIIAIGAKTADALSAAHAAGILHRDVKPGNILLAGYGEPVLSDFGIASLDANADASGNTDAFTPSYAAPEVLRGAEPSVAADIYSLAATIFAMLAGRAPFGSRAGNNPASVMLRVLAGEMPALDREDAPGALVDLLHLAMSVDVATRPTSAAALAKRLRLIGDQLGYTVPRVPPEPLGQPAAQTTPRQAPGRSGAGAGAGAGADAGSGSDAGVVDGVGWKVGAGSDVDARPDGDGQPDGADPVGEPTVLRPRPGVVAPRPRPPGTTLPAGGVNRRLAVATGVLATILVLLAVTAILAGGGTSRGHARGSGAASPGPVGSAALEEARPQALSISDQGTAALLTWKNGPALQPVVVAESNPARQGDLIALPAGDTLFPVTGLDPAVGYCFRVGAVMSLGGGQPDTFAWTAWSCIRGAMPPVG
jgi:serine/threonine-protein kinase PknK